MCCLLAVCRTVVLRSTHMVQLQAPAWVSSGRPHLPLLSPGVTANAHGMTSRPMPVRRLSTGGFCLTRGGTHYRGVRHGQKSRTPTSQSEIKQKSEREKLLTSAHVRILFRRPPRTSVYFRGLQWLKSGNHLEIQKSRMPDWRVSDPTRTMFTL